MGSLALPAHPSGLGGRFLYPRLRIFGRLSGPEGRHVVGEGREPLVRGALRIGSPVRGGMDLPGNGMGTVSPRWGS
jgi:hypothetical protein